MKTEISINHELGNYANLLLPAVFSPNVKPELNKESDRKISYPVMILLNSKGSEYLNESDVIDGFYDYENNYWYMAFDGNGYTPTKHDDTILGWRYLTCIENTKLFCAYRTMIKDKNGWIKVESSNDYPVKDCRYWIANENGVFDFFADKYQIARKFENGTLTHYKELDETLPPVELQS